MWKVIPKEKLPEGYELWESEDFVELRYKGKVISTFTQCVEMEEIIGACCKG